MPLIRLTCFFFIKIKYTRVSWLYFFFYKPVGYIDPLTLRLYEFVK